MLRKSPTDCFLLEVETHNLYGKCQDVTTHGKIKFLISRIYLAFIGRQS